MTKANGQGCLVWCCTFAVRMATVSLHFRGTSLPAQRLKSIGQQYGKQKDLGSIPFRLSALFTNCGLWTLSPGFVPHN